MHTFDVVLKLLLQQSKQILPQLAGVTVVNWLPTEFPRVQNRRLDLLGRMSNGQLVHFECQSTNHLYMPWRMAEYSLGVHREYGQFPLQFVLHVGREPLRKAANLPAPFESFRYVQIDVREIEGAPLLASTETSDTVFSILTRLSDQRRAVEQIVDKIASEPDSEQRGFYLEALLILAGLRGLEEKVEEEARKVPVFIDILENKVLGREYRRGHQEGIQEGLQEGLQEGRQEGLRQGERNLLRLQMEKRFGTLPEWASQRLEQLTEPELSDLGLRLFEAQTLEDLFSERSS
jgi:predicted transposase YdaD